LYAEASRKAESRQDRDHKTEGRDDLFPTEEMVENWKEKAKEYNEPLSRFVVEVVDDAIRRNPLGLTPRGNLEASCKRRRRRTGSSEKGSVTRD
jgi:hypothetical protein